MTFRLLLVLMAFFALATHEAEGYPGNEARSNAPPRGTPRPAGLGARRLRGNVARDERSLTNTFPFNQKAGGEEHHGDHGDHHGHHAYLRTLLVHPWRHQNLQIAH